MPSLRGVLVLELFPGAGLFGKAFEALGATVVRGPDILWGGDVREFHGAAGRFDGVIGGPPCQTFSRAAVSGSRAINLIPEYVRIVGECAPKWAVMENVREARRFAPNWAYVFLRDFDCGGKTHRRRGFWFYNLPAPPRPAARRGEAEYCVLASHWNYRRTSRLRSHKQLTAAQAADLQGYPDLSERIISGQPGRKRSDGRWDGLSERSREILAVHMLGNGVPHAMGNYIAHYVATMIRSEVQT
ncbi:MAG: DNA cytosine methyltransferase [Anaerolineae bacterium]|nr:DNA cytosine methyltransferase [Anaerolineae bacterium]